MVIYILIGTFLFMGIFVTKKFHKIYYTLSILTLFLFTAFRDINLGGYDAENYQRIFYYQVPQISDILSYTYEYEYGYIIFNSIIKFFSTDYRFYQIVYSLIAILLLCIVIKKLELNKGEQNLFLFIYFCYQFLWNNFILLRQNIAMLLLWIALLTFFDKKFKSYLGVIFSWLWHSSSIINIIIFPLLNIIRLVDRRKMLILTLVISSVFLLFSESVFAIFIDFFIQISGSKFEQYIEITPDSQGFNIVNYLLKWIFVIIFYLNFKEINNPHKELLLYSSFIAMMLGSINIAIVDRLVEYYMLSIYAIIPIIHQSFKGYVKYMYLIGLYFLFMIILVRFLYTFSNGEILKYSTFF